MIKINDILLSDDDDFFFFFKKKHILKNNFLVMLDQLEFVKSLLIISNFVLLFAIVVCSRRQSKFSTTLNDQIQRESVAIVIAHPDDEAMFFTPTINTLVDSQTTNNKQRYDVHIICLSNGNFKGLFSSLS